MELKEMSKFIMQLSCICLYDSITKVIEHFGDEFPCSLHFYLLLKIIGRPLRFYSRNLGSFKFNYCRMAIFLLNNLHNHLVN